MEKVETHVYELTPSEVRKLPPGTFVVCYDSIFKNYSSLKSAPEIKLRELSKAFYKVIEVNVSDIVAQAREEAHAAGLPFREPGEDDDYDYAGENLGPLDVYDGRMSLSDYKQLQLRREQKNE